MKQTTKELAMKGNKVWMAGRLPNANEMKRINNTKEDTIMNKSFKEVLTATKEEALATNGVIMVGKLPNKRDLGQVEEKVIEPINTVEDVVEIPAFMLALQEQRRMERLAREFRSRKPEKKKAKKITVVSSIAKLFRKGGFINENRID